MSLEALTQNRAVITQLQNVVADRRISHAYLFIGEESVRRQIAFEFAKAILCTESMADNCGSCVVCKKIDHGNHEDVIFIDQDGSSIKTEAIEGLISSISYKALGERSIVIMDHADTMTVPAQNKLLKTLEDPAGNAIIILLAERRNALTDTVISRCISFSLQEGNKAQDRQLFSLALEFIKLSSKSQAYFKKKSLIEHLIAERAMCLEFLDVLEEALRSLFLINANVPMLLSNNVDAASFGDLTCIDVGFVQQSINILENIRKAIQQNYNISYAMRLLCLQMDRRRLVEE